MAAIWPPEVKPEQGKASGTFTQVACTTTYTFTFWNVGETGGGDYGKTTFIAETKCTGSTKPDLETLQGIFSGGPNGKATVEGFVFNLVNGTYFVATDARGETHQFPVENPEIFSKYNWEATAEERALEDSGVAFSDVFGQVEVSIPRPDGSFDEESWEPVTFRKFFEKKRILPVGTHIKTFEKSGGIISFPDMTTFTLKPETEIVLSSPSSQDTVLKLLWGNLMVNVKKMMKDGSMEVEMSQAVAGIKGTIFSLEETKDKSTIKVIEGVVSFTSKKDGKAETVNAGEALTADTNGLGQKTTFDSTEEEKQWQELADGMNKTNPNILGSKNTIYIIGGIIITVIIIGFLFIKARKTN